MKKIIGGLFVMLLSVILLTGCGNTENEINNENDVESGKKNTNVVVKGTDKVKIDTSFSFDGSQLILNVSNKVKENLLYLEIEAVYYDKDDKVIGTEDTQLYNVATGRNSVIALYLPYDKTTYERIMPAKVEINATLDEEFQEYVDDYEMQHDKISSSYKVSGDEVKVTLKNNANFEVDDLYVAVVFKKKNTPLYIYEYDVYPNLKKGETDEYIVDIPYDINEKSFEKEFIKYDEIEVVINSAVFQK